MADYYPLIARAVAGLEKNTGEGRRALYERARTALVTQLRNTTPPLSETDITRERLALEEAIRRVEADAAKRSRAEEPAAERPPSAPVQPTPGQAAPAPAPPAARPPPAVAPQPEQGPALAPRLEDRKPAAPPPEPSTARTRGRPRSDRSLTDEGLKGFRDVVAEAEELGNATAQASKSAREAFAAVPSPSPEFERMEPHIEPEGLRSGQPPEPGLAPDEPHARLPHPQDEEAASVRPRRSYGGLIKALVLLLILAAVAGFAYWQRESIVALYQSITSSQQTARDETPPPPAIQPKDPARLGGQPDTPPSQPGQSPATVAQKVVLYEEDPNNPEGRGYVGSAVWRTEMVTAGPGQPPEMAVRADLQVPERRMTASFSIRRNTDPALPASHTIEIIFTLPADFASGGVNNVPGIMMKQAEATRGVPLAGLAVKVTTGFFLIGLSAVETDVQRNVQLLKERAWFDIPIVYNDNRRAILAIEKGTPGERAFEEAFRVWGR